MTICCLRATAALVFIAACKDVQPQTRETAAAGESTGAVTTVQAPVATQQSSAPSTEEDSIVARARTVLRGVTPSFREWNAEGYAPVQFDTAMPGTRMAPLVADFDGDGSPDVAFAGSDSTGAVIQAVVSNEGHPVVAIVAREKELAEDIDLRHSRLALAHDQFQGKQRQMLDVVVWDTTGHEITLSARFIYTSGRFAVLVSGE